MHTAGVGKLRPAGQMRPAKGKSAAREHVFYMNSIWPAKENFAAREHVNVARREKIFFNFNFLGSLTISDQFSLSPCKTF